MKILLCEFALSGHRLPYLISILDAWNRKELPAPVICFPQDVRFEKNQLESLKGVLFEGCELMFLNSEIGTEKFIDEVRATWKAEKIVIFQSNCERLISTISKGKCILENIEFYLIPFKPLLHYFTFISGLKMVLKPRWFKQCIRDLFVYYKISCCNEVKSIAFIDPIAASIFNKLFRTTKFSWIPDYLHASNDKLCPFELKNFDQDIKKDFLLVPGAITERKSVIKIIQSLVLSGMNERVYLVVAGKCDVNYKKQIIKCAIDMGFSDSLILIDRFVSNAELEWLFNNAAVVSALYRDFVGMSGIASKAINHNKALLVSSEGLLAQLVKDEALAEKCNPHDERSIACKINLLLDPSKRDISYTKQTKKYSSLKFGSGVVNYIAGCIMY